MAAPTPGDADYYDYVTKKGKYAPKTAVKKTIPKPAANAKSAFGEGKLGRQLAYSQKRRKDLSSGSSMTSAAKDLFFGK